MANSYIRDLRPWPLNRALPADALLLLYDFGTDEEYSLVPEQVGGGSGTTATVRATKSQEEDRGYTSLSAASNALLNEFGTLEGWTLIVERNYLETGDADPSLAQAVVSTQQQVSMLSTGTLILSGTIDGLRVTPPPAPLAGGPVRLFVASVHNCYVEGGTVAVTIEGNVFATDTPFVGNIQVLSPARLVLGPGTSFPQALLNSYARGADGIYTTPDGGTVSDERGGGLRTDITDVPVAKRIAVADAIIVQVAQGGEAMIRETDLSWAEKYFKDNRDPAAPAVYRCEKEINPTTGATEYWWNRYPIL